MTRIVIRGSYESPLGTGSPLEFILESFRPICAGAPVTDDERLFVTAWNRAIGRIHYLEAEIRSLQSHNESLRRTQRRGFWG